MLLWLLYHRVNADPSFASITKAALVVDEAAQWCQLLKATIADVKCDPSRAPTLLGLTFADLLVGSYLHGQTNELRAAKLFVHFCRAKRSHSALRISWLWLSCVLDQAG
jgi:hypothetical protein